MPGDRPMARAALGAEPLNTLGTDTLTFAIMEFLLNGDSNAMKALWLKYGFKDLSPIWGDKKTVPTFKDDAATIKQWEDFQAQMEKVEADWYYLSGHHASQFASDREGVDTLAHVNTHDNIGFFNEPYHTGPWEQANAADVSVGRSAKDVYMVTSHDRWTDYPGVEDNPLYGYPRESCKGVLLVGCNSLIYLADRNMYCQYFPNAVVIGTVSREANCITKLLKMAQQHGKSFFKDPKSVDPIDLCAELNKTRGAMDLMGVLSDGMFYYPHLKGVAAQSATDPIPPADQRQAVR